MPGDVRDSDEEPSPPEPGQGGFAFLDEWFSSFLEERRREPKGDVLTDIALAQYPDGSEPPLAEITRTATFLFLAGTETSARLLATCLQFLAENPAVQERLRDDRELIPNFVEEALRFESPVKTDCRLVRRTTTLGGVELPAGTCVSIFLGAANRDPRHFESPTPSSVRTGRTPRPISRSGAGFTPARVDRSPGPRPGSRSTAFLIASATSGCRRSTTVRPALDASNTRRRMCCEVSSASTWSSRRSIGERPGRGRHGRGVGHRTGCRAAPRG